MGDRNTPEWYFNIHVLMNAARYRGGEAELSRLPADTEALGKAAAKVLADAMNVAIPAYHFADQMFVEYARSRPEVVYRTSELRHYRAYLDAFRCRDMASGEPVPDLALLGAVVDTYKHAELTKASRPTSAPRAFAKIGALAGKAAPRVVVIQDGQAARSFAGIIENVVAMWQNELTAHGLREPIGYLGAGDDRSYRY